MKISQAYELINTLNTEMFGIEQPTEENPDGSNMQYVVTETDTSGIVTTGKTLQQKLDDPMSNFVDNYVLGLLSRISRIVAVDRVFTDTPLSMMRTSEVWGEVVEKVRFAIGDVKEDESWNLVAGENYCQDTYYPPTVQVKLFDGVSPFVYPISKTRKQILSAFTNETELLAFMNALEVSISNAMKIYLAGLEVATLDTFMASILADDTNSQRKVMLLSEYNEEHPNATITTPEEAIANEAFLVWMCARIDQDVKDMKVPGTFYNGTDVYPTFTPDDKKVFVLLSPVATRVNSIAKASIFNADFVRLPMYKELPNWQGRKDASRNVSFKAKSTLDITNTQAINTGTDESPSHNYKSEYIIGCLYDYDAMGINLYERAVDVTPYNARGCFWTEYNRAKGRYFIDTSENGVVYVLA